MTKERIFVLKNLRLITIGLLVSLAGCTWLLPESYYNNPHQQTCENMVIEKSRQRGMQLDQELVGLGKEDVILKLGKPKPKYISFNRPYSVSRDCVNVNCESKVADEVWFYDLEMGVSSCGHYAYSLIVYFKDNKVVRVR